jgi:hypothetical protein
MSEELKRSVGPGQWAPWISDPDPPEEPMTPEQSKAAAKATKDLVPQVPARSSSNPPEQEDEEMGERILANVLRNHPDLTREEAQKMLDHFL